MKLTTTMKRRLTKIHNAGVSMEEIPENTWSFLSKKYLTREEHLSFKNKLALLSRVIDDKTIDLKVV